MPELPEVETIVRDLRKKVVEKKISQVEVFLKKSVKNSLNDFLTKLRYNKIISIMRRGKLMIFELADHHYLLVHLRMTGQLIYCQDKNIIAGGHSDKNILFCVPGKHTRIAIIFSDKSLLLFNDLRTFGFMQIVKEKELIGITEKYGKEALELDYVFLKEILKNRSLNIKSALLSQQLIAGIGNIYADEALFDARILPQRPAKSLNDTELKRLAASIKKILLKSIEQRGTTFNNYRDASGNKGSYIQMLKVYGRQGEKCRRCGNIIQKIKLGQRGTSYCEVCQV